VAFISLSLGLQKIEIKQTYCFYIISDKVSAKNLLYLHLLQKNEFHNMNFNTKKAAKGAKVLPKFLLECLL